MDCPRCNHHLQPERTDIEGVIYHCTQCGWGSDRLSAKDPSDENLTSLTPKIPAATWIKLPIFLTISFLIIVGPFLLLVFGPPILGLVAGWEFLDANPDRIAASLTPGYWIAVAIYLMLASLVDGGVEFDNLGLFGGMVDNPLSVEDDFNRAKLVLTILLIPGKFVLFTLKGTFLILKRLTADR